MTSAVFPKLALKSVINAIAEKVSERFAFDTMTEKNSIHSLCLHERLTTFVALKG
jgi:hypothetical protein